MRAIIQRVSEARVEVEGEKIAAINQGLLILLGVEEADEMTDVTWLAEKTAALRIFSDKEGKMNLSINDVAGDAIVVSQFTLHAKTKKGTRPSFIYAAKPEKAEKLYEAFKTHLFKCINGIVGSGEFGENMQVSLCNDGPVTIFIDTANKK